MAINMLEDNKDLHRPERWRPTLLVYDPLKAGSIDGTDTVPHDRAIWRAMHATYKPPKNLPSDPDCTIFVGRLTRTTVESDLEQHFKKYGEIVSVNLIRDIVTGFSKCYAFIEFAERRDARDAQRANGAFIDQKQIMVEMECGRKMKGWIPRRLGGGFCGRKESGQLRFGCNQKPFKRPFSMIQEQRQTLRDEFGTMSERLPAFQDDRNDGQFSRTPYNRSFGDSHRGSFGHSNRGSFGHSNRGSFGNTNRGYFGHSNRGSYRGGHDQAQNRNYRSSAENAARDPSDRRGIGAPRRRFGEDHGYSEDPIGPVEDRPRRRTREEDPTYSSDHRQKDCSQPKEYIMLYDKLRSRDDLRNPPPPPPEPEPSSKKSKNLRDREQSFRVRDDGGKSETDTKRERLKKIEKARKERGRSREPSRHPDWEFYERGKW